MAETLTINKNQSKAGIYEDILPQIQSIISGEQNLIANLANIAAILNEAFAHLWTGFYLKEGAALVLGPFQGPLACTRIPVEPTPRGVCGVAAATKQTQLVPDVNQFQGHIACSSRSRSEIVVPLVYDGETKLVLDIDSEFLESFDRVDQHYLEKVITIIMNHHYGF